MLNIEKTTTEMTNKVTNEKFTSIIYSYESKAKRYDVMIYNGLQFVRLNMGNWSNLVCDFKQTHYKILAHYKLI